MTVEQPTSTNEIIDSFDELQTFINDPKLKIPNNNRDLSNKRNILWLLRNPIDPPLPLNYKNALIRAARK